jgi:hypothetical protein
VSTTTFGDKTLTQIQYMTADRARTTSGDTDSIVEYASGRIVSIDHKKKEYTETTFEEMAAMMRQAEAEIAKLPSFAQKAMGGAVGDVTVVKGTQIRKIAGYDCTQYTLTMGQDFVYDLWATPALVYPIKYVDSMKAQYVAMGHAGRKFLKMFDEMKAIKGYPLAFGMNYKLMGKKIATLTEATEVKRGPIPASTFGIPAGYKRKDSPFKQK